MTREEAIAYFKRCIYIYRTEGLCTEAEEIAIKALEALDQQPTDAVDRVTIKEYLESFKVERPKMGRWVKHDTGHSIYYDCSLCSCVAPCIETRDKILWRLTNYCPDCGAKMSEVKE